MTDYRKTDEVVIVGGETVPCLGQGTWNMGERADRRADEIAALRAGVELGMTLVDTAEMYGDGATEELVGEALSGIRDDVFLVSKAYPQNASRDRLERACEVSLRRLRTDRLDLYLLHWRGRVPLAETVGAMEALVTAGKIRHWGVSNLDVDDMEELVAASGAACVTDQILYNLGRRGPERELLPWLTEHGMSAMAYSPVEQGRQDLEIAHLHRTADGSFVAAHGFRATQDKDVALRAAGREHLILDVGEIETDLDRLAPRCWQDLIDVIDVAIDHHRLTAHREAGGRSDLGGRRPRRSAPLVIGIPVELRRRAGRQRAAQGSQQALARRPTASHMHGVSRRDLHARPSVRRPWRQLEVRLRGRRR